MTDFRRLVILSLLFMVGLMLWNTWMVEHAPKPSIANQVVSPLTPLTTAPSTQSSTIVPTGSSTTAPIANRYIQVKTNVLTATIDRVGGTLTQVALLKYPVAVNQPNTPYVLLNDAPDTYYVATSGITGTDVPPINQMVFHAAQQQYILQDGQKTLSVDLTWQNSQGLKIVKTYTFPADDYLIQVNHQIENQAGSLWQGQFFAELQRTPINPGGMGPFHFNTYLGAVVSSPDKRYEKLPFKEMDEQDLSRETQDGWLAMVQHYFLSAWIPTSTQNYHYYSNVNNDIYSIGLKSQPLIVQPHQQANTHAQLYVGPEIADRLTQIAPGLNLTVDYGLLWFIADAIFWLMKKIYLFTGNWGWAIVLVTLFIKLLFYKLNSISFRSMAALRELQPKLQQLKERCGDDRQKLSQATMELYKREKINPMGGCLPLIVQIPVFLALYWVLAGSVELRQAPFIFWIHDLSLKDPYYVLPLLMGLTIFIQQWLAPKSPDPVQQKVMMLLPVIFTALFLTFPSGLVLYWVVNNSLSILQQWYIMKHVVPKANKK
jgi:YidC/Oxa1 family membrane protein insertase